ncbi:MAG: hypothetical protein ACRDVM_07695 [Acidimicrobiia bacterium]
MLDWLEGALDEHRSAEIATAVAAAPGADDDLRWLRAFLRVAGAEVMIASPGPELRRALEETFTPGRRRSRPVQRFLAALTFDSLLGSMPAGARAGAAEAQRHLVFSTEVADVALDLYQTPPGGIIDISGQLLPAEPADPTRFVVELVQEAAPVDVTLTDDLGEFDFERVPAGDYRIVLRDSRREITVGPVGLAIGP